MIEPAVGDAGRLGEIDAEQIRRRLRGDGLVLDLGAAAFRLRSELPELAALLARTYPSFPLLDPVGFVDASVELRAARGLRRWARPQASIEVDGIDPFGPFPREQALPYLEWGMNWAFAHLFNSCLLLHAGCVAVDGRALVLVAQPGAGKSTLSAALAARGARLLSDEFGVVRTRDLAMLAVVKPIALKNRSIEVIRTWSQHAVFGPVFTNTRKGVLCHHAVRRESVDRRREPARPVALVFPSWTEGRASSITPVAQARAFMELAANSFNYELLGQTGFETVAALLERCPAYRLEYGDLGDAVPRLLGLCAASGGGS